MALSSGRSLRAYSKLLNLQPRLDDDGLLRSDSRLKMQNFYRMTLAFRSFYPGKSGYNYNDCQGVSRKGRSRFRDQPDSSCPFHSLLGDVWP